MRKNLILIWLLIKFKFSRMMMFRTDFFLAFFGDGALFLTQLITFETIYSQTDNIGGWSRGQMIIFIGTFSVINALNMFIFFFGIVGIPGKIKRGDLDQYLTKPVNPLLRLTFESVNIGSFPLVILSILIVMYGISVTGIKISPATGFGYAVLVLLMTLLWYDMMLILRTIPFFVISANGIMRIEDQLIYLNFKVPGVLYKGTLKVLFYFILPYGVMSTVPTQFLTGALTVPGLLQAFCVVIFFTFFTFWFWRLGLKNYKSSGS